MKINQKDRRDIERMAAALPNIQNSNPDGSPLFKWVKEKGAQLLADDPQATSKTGQPIEATRSYWRRVPVMVNHKHTLLGIFRVEGMDGCREYCDVVKAFVSGAKKRRPWYMRMYYRALLRLGITTAYMREQRKLHQLMNPTK